MCVSNLPCKYRATQVILIAISKHCSAKFFIDILNTCSKRQRNIKDKDSGLTTTVEVNKRVRQWWFVNRDTNKVALQLRYGTKVIEFAKGKNAIEVNSGEELITTLQKLRTATMSGELDEIITTTSLLVKARFNK